MWKSEVRNDYYPQFHLLVIVIVVVSMIGPAGWAIGKLLDIIVATYDLSAVRTRWNGAFGPWAIMKWRKTKGQRVVCGSDKGMLCGVSLWRGGIGVHIRPQLNSELLNGFIVNFRKEIFCYFYKEPLFFAHRE